MLPTENRVLIKYSRVEKGYSTKRIMNEFTRSGAFCKSESTTARSVTFDYLKEWVIEEWRHDDHDIIDTLIELSIR